jgi:hypothetical protein
VHALLYHGAYTRAAGGGTWDGNPLCSDYFAAADNHATRLVEPLLAAGAQVLVYFHTYSTCNASRDARLVQSLQPVSYRFVPLGSTSNIVESYVAVLDLLSTSGRHADFIHMMRFDLYFRTPPLTLTIAWDRLNLPWRDEEYNWDSMRTTSDLWAVLPASYAKGYREALIYSGNFEAPCCDGAGHWIHDAYNSRRNATDAVHFVRDGFWRSTQDMLSVTDTPPDDLFLAILRTCPRDVSCE